ncbi:MAG TPA: DUF4340 domain-containing protein [bacterium]|nr:DUF4340 domain-containing protein [bacterium]
MKRNTLVLAGLVVLLWGAWYVFHTEEKTELSIRERRDFFKADSTAVDSIAVKYANWAYLSRRGGNWTVIFPEYSHAADPNILRDVFRFTNEMVLENLISTRPEKHSSFQVDTTSGTVLQFFAGGVPVAEFVMGKAGADFNHTYIRQLQSDSVYMARGDFQRVFRRVPTDWGSRVIAETDSAQLVSVRWITRDGEVRVARADNGPWLVYKDGAAAGLPVDTAVFNVRLRRFTPLTTDAFASAGTGVEAETDNPYMQLILDSRDGRSDTLLWNHPKEDDGRYFAFRPGRPKPLFIFYKGSFDRIKGVYADLIDKGGIKRIDEPQ